MKDIFAKEYIYFKNSCNEQEVEEFDTVELTFQEFPSLQEALDGGFANNLKTTPTLNKLNHYIIDMASSYHEIGLDLGIP